MTAKEKAEELVNKYHDIVVGNLNEDIIKEFESKEIEYEGSKLTAIWRYAKKERAKQCALIAVTNTIKALDNIKDSKMDVDVILIHLRYWQQVKIEIEKL